MSVIVYGPQGCGKTTNAKLLAQHFGLNHIIDDGFYENGNAWYPGEIIPSSTLVLTNIPGISEAINFDDVMASMRSDLASS